MENQPDVGSAYLLPLYPRRSPLSRFLRWLSRNGAAISISLMSAAFTGWQAYEAHQARFDAKNAVAQANREAKEASDKQMEDVRAARRAAEDSARAAQELAEGMNRSARATEMSAGIAKELLKTSNSSLHMEQRPNLQLVGTEYKQNQYMFYGRVINNGKTTAQRTSWSCDAISYEENNKFLKYGPMHTNAPFDVPPGVTFDVIGSLDWSPEMRGNKWYDIKCTIKYWDPFDDKEPHELSYCYGMFVAHNEIIPAPITCGMTSK